MTTLSGSRMNTSLPFSGRSHEIFFSPPFCNYKRSLFALLPPSDATGANTDELEDEASEEADEDAIAAASV